MPVTWSDEKLILLYCPGRGSNSRPSAHRSFKHAQGVLRPYPLGHGGGYSDMNSASLGSILPMQQLRTKNISSHFNHCLYPGTHLYSCVNFLTETKGDLNPGSLDRESTTVGISSITI